jgi:hypothetical protein
VGEQRAAASTPGRGTLGVPGVQSTLDPKVAKPVAISGRPGDDARHYQQKSAKAAFEEEQR